MAKILVPLMSRYEAIMASFTDHANTEVSIVKRNGSTLIVLEPLPYYSLPAVALGVSSFNAEKLHSVCEYGWQEKSENELDRVNYS